MRRIETHVVCRTRDALPALLELRRWADEAQREDPAIGPVVHETSAEDALAGGHASSAYRVLFLAGFPPSEIEALAERSRGSGFDVVMATGDDPAPSRNGSAGVRLAADPAQAMRRLCRDLRRDGSFAVREITDPDDFRQYAELRYRVWKAEGHIPAVMDAASARLELDFRDRFARHVGAFDADGRIVACARLIYGLGRGPRCGESLLDKLAATVDDPVFHDGLRPPSMFIQPFDILDFMPDFLDHYRTLVGRNMEKAELSRVIVDPDHRGRKLSLRLVDRMVDLARADGIDVLFLACRPELAKLYGSAGFHSLDVSHHDFGAIRVPSIVMERVLDGRVQNARVWA